MRHSWKVTPAAVVYYGIWLMAVPTSAVKACGPAPKLTGAASIEATNTATQTAASLAVNVDTAVGQGSALPFTSAAITPGGATFSGGTLASGDSTVANIFSNLGPSPGGPIFGPHISGGTFSSVSGTLISGFSAPNLKIEAAPTSIPNTFSVSALNTGSSAISYSGLHIFEHADEHFFTPPSYLSGLTQTGTPVDLLVPTSGTFDPGLTTLALIDPPPPTSPFYDGGIVTLDGVFEGGAVNIQPSAVPEPGTMVMGLTALLVLGSVIGYRRLRRAVAGSMV